MARVRRRLSREYRTALVFVLCHSCSDAPLPLRHGWGRAPWAMCWVLDHTTRPRSYSCHKLVWLTVFDLGSRYPATGSYSTQYVKSPPTLIPHCSSVDVTFPCRGLLHPVLPVPTPRRANRRARRWRQVGMRYGAHREARKCVLLVIRGCAAGACPGW
ncbi:hypothetical protein EDB85DRAFT_66534 [Lactarius pseudohatsudake]|nr:hypothetical protein EDB85DRAFT_66534 [Lactarius pseudohatsudake]